MQRVPREDQYEVWDLGRRVYEEVLTWWLDDTKPFEGDIETPFTQVTTSTITAGAITGARIYLSPGGPSIGPGDFVSIDPYSGKAVPATPNDSPYGIVMDSGPDGTRVSITKEALAFFRNPRRKIRR